MNKHRKWAAAQPIKNYGGGKCSVCRDKVAVEITACVVSDRSAGKNFVTNRDLWRYVVEQTGNQYSESTIDRHVRNCILGKAKK